MNLPSPDGTEPLVCVFDGCGAEALWGYWWVTAIGWDADGHVVEETEGPFCEAHSGGHQ